MESLFGDMLGGWQDESGLGPTEYEEKPPLVDNATLEVERGDVDFDEEFEEIGELNPDGSNEGGPCCSPNFAPIPAYGADTM